MTCFRARIRYLALILVSLCIGIGGGFLLSEHRQKTVLIIRSTFTA